MPNRRSVIRVGMLVIAALAAGIVTAQEVEQVIQGRIASYREIGTAHKQIKDELRSKQPDLSKITQAAQLIKDRGADMLHWFPPGSEPPPQEKKSWLDTILGWFSSDDGLAFASEAESHARPAVWSQRSKFEQEHRRFKAEAARMLQAAQSGQTAAISAQFKNLGESCESCHEVFREKHD